MMVRLRVEMVLALGLISSVMMPASAAAASGEPAVTKLADVDEDFDLMGEYQGGLVTETAGVQRVVGLQVIALGGGQFEATLFEGGLPGNGWNRTSRRSLQGSGSGDRLTLTGEGVEINIHRHRAEVSDPEQGMLGVLAKVKRRSVYEGLPPAANSYVLFDGNNSAAFRNAKVVDGLLQVGADLIPTFRDFQLHVEFLLPYMPNSRSQSRANSGVYLQSRYEVQILDSFGLKGEKNQCGGLYKQRAPDINMAFPPLSWQTYDITFRAPRFDNCGNKVANARLTVLHNGVKIHDNIHILTKTGAGKPEGPQPLPIRFQDHSNPVQFRNIWLLAN